MRMWMLNPKLLCNKHLLGEHGEIHKHRHCFEKHYSIAGRISPVIQIEPLAMQDRHAALAAEMLFRGMQHKSPYTLPDLSYLPAEQRAAKVDVFISIQDLQARCPECEARLHNRFL
jgi:hypothetical protein